MGRVMDFVKFRYCYFDMIGAGFAKGSSGFVSVSYIVRRRDVDTVVFTILFCGDW